MILPFDRSSFRWGQPGLPGTGITTGEKNTINSRLDALEAVTPATTLAGLSDTNITSPAVGTYLRWDGTDWIDQGIDPVTLTFNVPFVLDGGGSTITTGVKYLGVEIPFAATITGWTFAGNATGSIVCTVSKATYAAHTTYTAISGTEKPTISSSTKGQDLTLTTWTTAVSAGDLLQVSVDSASTISFATLNLRMTRTF